MPKPMSTHQDTVHAYWRANLRLIGIYLGIWFAASYGCGILFVDLLDQYSLFGYPLGFWFAQQGSIYLFVLIVWGYMFSMNRLDKQYDVQE